MIDARGQISLCNVKKTPGTFDKLTFAIDFERNAL